MGNKYCKKLPTKEKFFRKILAASTDVIRCCRKFEIYLLKSMTHCRHYHVNKLTLLCLAGSISNTVYEAFKNEKNNTRVDFPLIN